MKNLGFVGDNVYPCLYMKKSAKGVVFIVLYLDNNLMVREIKAIGDTISALKSDRLTLNIMERLKNYMSCNIKFF